MKLIFFIDFGKDIGGGSSSIVQFAKHLALLKHKVTIFITTETKLPNFNLPENVAIYTRCKIRSQIRGSWIIDNFFEKFYEFTVMNRFLINNSDIDYIIGHQVRSSIKVVSYAKKYNIKSVSFIFETSDWLYRQSTSWLIKWKKSFRLRNSWYKFKTALLDSDIIIANSNLTADETYKWCNRQVDGIIYPGFQVPKLDSKNIKKENQIMFLGRLRGHKNVDDLIRAFTKLTTNYKLVICGSGPKFNELQKLPNSLKSNIEFMGSITENEKWRQLIKSKLMVFPSSFEGFGMPPMEALSVGTPCVCSDIPIFKEVYKNNVDYFRVHDIEELSDKINWHIKNPEKSKTLGEKGKAYINKYFGLGISTLKLEKILKDYIE